MLVIQKFLFKSFGIYPALIFGDTLVLDRWYWLRSNLPKTSYPLRILDIGCGSGTFSLAAARRGYEVLGISNDQKQNDKGKQRASWTSSYNVDFLTLDIRDLDARPELYSSFDLIICCETIEHIIDDEKLISDIGMCLKPGGRLLLTAPYSYNRPISKDEEGPFPLIEDGGHVRRGYTKKSLSTLLQNTELVVERIGFCSGYFSQILTRVLRILEGFSYKFGWLITLPLRMFVIILDPLVRHTQLWPDYSITLVASKTPASD